jgi:hypothetical protein
MKAALLFQLASLFASVAMVPLLLGYLGAKDYLLWAIFTTLGGLTLQLESAIQTLMVRRVAPAWARGEPDRFRAELRRARLAYMALSLAVLLLLLPGGWLYLASISGGIAHWADSPWAAAWLAFTLAYALNYLFGPNNVLLLATAAIDRFYWINTGSRVLNIALTAAALVLGLGLIGVSASFLASVVVNVGAMAVAASALRRAMRTPGSVFGQANTAVNGTADRKPADDAGLVRYTLFTLVGFLLYRGAFLLAAQYQETAAAAGYGLALQAFAIIFAVAIVPMTVWLHRIVAAINAADTAREDREILRAVLFAVAAIAGGTLALEIVGPFLLDRIGSEVALPDGPTLMLMGFVFLVEALILICVNPLLLRGELGFIRPYVLLAGAALVGAAAALWLGAHRLGDAPLVVLLALPALVQAAITLPVIAGKLANAQGRDLGGLLRGLGRALRLDIGRAA